MISNLKQRSQTLNMMILKFFFCLLFIGASEGKRAVQCPSLQDTSSTESLSVDLEARIESEAVFQLSLEPFPSGLCTLTIVSTDPENPYLIPVARSFDNRQWQLAAGPFATSLDLDCPEYDIGTTKTCQIYLPPIKKSETFRLTSYKPYTSNSRALTVRFLERATFGATDDQEVIENYQDWLKQQFDATPTFHREVFRRHANPRSERHTPIAAAGPHPCEKNSRWRRYAFTSQDAGGIMRMVRHQRPQGEEIYLMVDGVFRTKISEPMQLVKNKGNTIEMIFDVDYEICNDIMSNFYQENAPIRVRRQGQQRCFELRDGNPSIQLPVGLSDGAHSDSDLPSYIISIPDSAMSPIDDETYPSLYWKSFRSGDEFLLTTTIDVPSCSLLSITNGPPMVHGRLQNSNEALLFEPRVVLQENTVENPIPDGGGSLVLETNSLTSCANAPRTFLNEDHCVLSTSATACEASENIEIEIDLSEEFIKTANQFANRYVRIDRFPYFCSTRFLAHFSMTDLCSR